MPFLEKVILIFDPGQMFLGVKSMVIFCDFKTTVELIMKKKVSKSLFILFVLILFFVVVIVKPRKY